MILTTQNKISAGSLPEESAEFGIDGTQVAHIMSILRSNLYTKKALAVIREYSANAWDAHRSAGKGGLPIEVTIPTRSEPTFTVRDYGTGLSRADVLYNLTQYGHSTKRASNLEVGGLGIGFKAGFCLTSQFTVTSWHGGVKAIYTAALDASNKGVMSLFHEEPCGDETGLEVSVPVQPSMLHEFEIEAARFFPTMNPLPRINIPLQEHEAEEDGSWYKITGGSGEQWWTGVMGCVPYRIDLHHPALEDLLLKRLRGTVNAGFVLPIGSVDFSANREELQYTPRTINVIRERVTQVSDNYVTRLLASLEDSRISGWDRRLQYYEAVKVMGLIQDKEARLCEARIPATAEYTVSHRLEVSPRTVLYMHPGVDHDTRHVRGWSIPDGCSMIAPRAGVTREAAQAALEQNLKDIDLDGIPIRPVTILPWSKVAGIQAADNMKHRKLIFTFKDAHEVGSKRWEIASELPEGHHVFVRIESFKCTHFDDHVVRLRGIITRLGGVWPTIYGYKVTSQKSWLSSDIPEGVHFSKWVLDTITNLAGADIHEYGWAHAHTGCHRHQQRAPLDALQRWIEALPANHLITQGVARMIDADKSVGQWSFDKISAFRSLIHNEVRFSDTEASDWLGEIRKKYPMLSRGDGLIFQSVTDAIQYVKERDFFLEHLPSEE